MPVKEIVRTLGVARNTVRSALASDGPPRYVREARGSLVDAVEPRVRELLHAFPRMPATVIAERIGWEHSITILKDRIREIRPEYGAVLVGWVTVQLPLIGWSSPIQWLFLGVGIAEIAAAGTWWSRERRHR